MNVQIHQIPSDKMDSNTYLIEKNGHCLIIDGCSGQAVWEKIEAAGWQADYLFLTHEHFDHIWYLEALRERLSLPVVACRLTGERIQDVKSNLSNISDLLYYFKTGIVLEGKSKAFTCRGADITFEDAFTLSWQGFRFDFQRLPGHSPGSTLITMAPVGASEEGGDEAGASTSDRSSAGVSGWEHAAEDAKREHEPVRVFSGDYLIYGEEEITRLKDGSPEDYEAIARPILEAIPAGTIICPGHGPVYRMGEAPEESGDR